MLLTLLLAGSLANGPSVDEILEKAIAVQRLHEEAGNEVKYDYEILNVSEKLDKHGDVKEVEEQLFESSHINNVAYERLVEKNGKALTEKELKREAKRERDFREKLEKGDAQRNDDEDNVVFDEELIERYDFALDDVRDVSGRRTYILSYKPKPGKLPEKKRMDRIINKTRGSLWVDAETFQITQVEFELTERVKLWWGVLGSISKMKGTFKRHPVSDEIWLPERAVFYVKGRVLFRSLHVRENIFWSDFAKRPHLRQGSGGQEPKIAASPSSESSEKPR